MGRAERERCLGIGGFGGLILRRGPPAAGEEPSEVEEREWKGEVKVKFGAKGKREKEAREVKRWIGEIGRAHV